MKQYTSTCDRCKKTETSESPSDNKLLLLEVGVGIRRWANYNNYELVGPKQEWCRDCCIKVGLMPPDDQNAIVPAPPTIEDMLREMVREEIQNATGA